jgi:hypothetical protein
MSVPLDQESCTQRPKEINTFYISFNVTAPDSCDARSNAPFQLEVFIDGVSTGTSVVAQLEFGETKTFTPQSASGFPQTLVENSTPTIHTVEVRVTNECTEVGEDFTSP